MGVDLLQDLTGGPPSPSKGKGVDVSNKTWRASWWDFYPLLERPKRQMQWSQSSVIFTAHPTQALITGRHFSSSKQFVLPSPQPIIASPGSYEPPSVLSVSPGDLWLYAFFPRRDGEGVGCLWKRGAQIDIWPVNEFWTYPKGGGAVTASWLGSHREWVADGQGNPTRLPPRGPHTPISDPNLLVVTEDNWLHLAFSRHYHSGIRFIKRQLSFTGTSSETSPNIDLGDYPNNTRRCTDAAIGLGYNEMTIFVATHSLRVPPPTRKAATTSAFNSMDLTVPVGLPNLNVPDQKIMEWEIWGDERTLELFEVYLRFDGANMALSSNLISTQDCSVPLINMTFACAPPSPSPLADSGSPSKRNVGERNHVEKGKVYLITATADFHDYIKPPTSSLFSYSLVYRPAASGGRSHIWSLQKEATRVFEGGFMSYVQPFLDLSHSTSLSMYACILDISGPIPAGQKEVAIGMSKVLALPDFSGNSSWEPSAIKCHINSLGKDLPILSATSPNRALLCTLPLSSSNMQTICSLPKRSISNASSPNISHDLAVALLGRVATSDLVHSLCSPHLSRNEATNIIYHTLDILDKYHKSQIPNASTWEIVGIATEVYRARSLYTKDEAEAEVLKELWQTAHDICSLAACNFAFDGCKDNDEYDLDSVWQMISICTWVVSFTERLMKACVLSSNSLIEDKVSGNPKGGSSDPLHQTPILLHLCHPFALQNFIKALEHVKALRAYIGTLPAGGEHAKVAQVVLVDAVDCSGVNFGDLLLLLGESFESAQQLEPQEPRKALAACQPTLAMRPRLGNLLQKISQSETILNKSTLFIKPYDLVDGMARLAVVNHRKNDARDVITKSILDNQGSKRLCLRCGERSSIVLKDPFPPLQSNPKWSVWELMWQRRCICGGSWLSVVRS